MRAHGDFDASYGLGHPFGSLVGLCLRKMPNGVGGLAFPVAPPIGASRGFFTTLPPLAAGAFAAPPDDAGGVVGLGSEGAGAGSLPLMLPMKPPRPVGSHCLPLSWRDASTPCAAAPAATSTPPEVAPKKIALAIAKQSTRGRGRRDVRERGTEKRARGVRRGCGQVLQCEDGQMQGGTDAIVSRLLAVNRHPPAIGRARSRCTRAVHG